MTGGEWLKAIIHDAQEHIDSKCESVLQAKVLTSTTTNAEISHLWDHNVHLKKLLESEKIKVEKVKDELIPAGVWFAW